ncbi:hypothetical protein BRC89_06475 [Halobacteriales archaeon QS_4_70_19]|nr:MAG: hypothetical protein BRC89_06475 [Halobacteriales archaeon QS_4_70_19]
MPDRRQLTRRAALGLVAGGGLLATSETLGFSNVTADRGVSIETADDANALLGFTNYEDSSKIPTFTNNADSSMSVTLDSERSVKFDIGTDGTYVTPPTTFSLAVDESKETNIRFTGECNDAGSAAVSTDATLDDGTTTIGSISFTRDWQIPASGQVRFNGSAGTAGASGKYEFDLENTGCEDVTFVGIGIKETTTDADYVSGGGSLFDASGTELVSDHISIDSSNPDSDTRRDLDPNVTLSVNDTITWTFEKFQRSSNGKANVDMRSQDVKIRLYLSDGSMTTEKLCLDGCDF